MPVLHIFLIIFVSLSVSVSSLSAEKDDARSISDIGSIDISTQKNNESKYDAASLSHIIDVDELTGQRSLANAISRISGVRLRASGGDSQLSTVSLRGSTSSQVKVLLDGIVLNSPLNGGFDWSTIPISLLDRIEILPGAMSSRFGSGAMGGVIALTSNAFQTNRSATAILSLGSFKTVKTGISWFEPIKTGNFFISHHHKSTGGNYSFQTPDVRIGGRPISRGQSFTRLHNSSVSENFMVKMSFFPRSHWKISLLNDFIWMDRENPGAELETTQLYPANPLAAQERLLQNNIVASIKRTNIFSLPFAWHMTGGYRIAYNRFSDPSPAIGNEINSRFFTHAVTMNHQLSHDFIGDYIHLMNNARFNYQLHMSHDEQAFDIDLGTQLRHQLGVGIDTTISHHENRWQLIPALYAEYADDREWQLSAKLGAVGHIHPAVAIKANIGNAYRYPTFNELYFPDQGSVRGNHELSDETLWSWDMGLYITTKYCHVSAAYFQQYIDNMIVYVPISAFTIAPQNTSNAHIDGVELNARLIIDTYAQLDINYTRLRSKYTLTQLQLPGRSNHDLYMHVSGTVAGVSPYIEWRYVSAFPTNTGNTVWVSGYHNLSMGLKYQINDYIYLSMDIADVLNAQRYDQLGYPLPRRSFLVTVGSGYTKKNRS